MVLYQLLGIIIMTTLKGKNEDTLEIYLEDGLIKALTFYDGKGFHPDPEYVAVPEFTKEQLIKFHNELGEFIKTLNCA